MKRKNKKILLFGLIFSLFFPINLLAQTTTPIENNTLGTSDEIKKIRETVQEKVKQKLDKIINKINKKQAWLGSISKIEDMQITITSPNYQQRRVKVQPNTVFINLNRQKTTLAKLKKGQIILAMGSYAPNPDQTEVSLETSRIVISKNNVQDMRKKIVVGTISDISKSSNVFTLIPLSSDKSQYQVKYSSKTIQKTDLKIKNKIITILKTDPKNKNDFILVDYKMIKSNNQPTQTQTPTPTDNN